MLKAVYSNKTNRSSTVKYPPINRNSNASRSHIGGPPIKLRFYTPLEMEQGWHHAGLFGEDIPQLGDHHGESSLPPDEPLLPRGLKGSALQSIVLTAQKYIIYIEREREKEMILQIPGS